jgi:transposase
MQTPDLFAAALGLSAPWHVTATEFRAATPTERGRLEIRIDFLRGGELPCPECGTACKAYDTDEQRWRHLNFFEHEAYLTARVPRVDCPTHGVGRVRVPWARPGSGFTLLFEAFVVMLAAEMPMAALARLVGENDTRLWRIVQWHVNDARAQVDMSAVTALVVDETSRAKRHHYVSLFLEPAPPPLPATRTDPAATRARVLFVTEGRAHGVFHEFVDDLVAHGGTPTQVRDVCMDLSPAYQRGAAEALPAAAITFDRFHVMKLVSAALDDARRREQPAHPELKRSRYAWLTNPANASAGQHATVERLSTLHLRTAKAYQMRLNLQGLWAERTPEAAARYLRRWCTWVKRVGKRPTDPTAPWVLEAMYRTAETLRANARGILNYFRLRLTSGVIESVNGLAQAARARARVVRDAGVEVLVVEEVVGAEGGGLVG